MSARRQASIALQRAQQRLYPSSQTNAAAQDGPTSVGEDPAAQCALPLEREANLVRFGSIGLDMFVV